MRKITQEAVQAFKSNQNFRKSNTEVKVQKDITKLSLFGNTIAVKDNRGIKVTNCGWQTNTTKERLKALLPSNVGICTIKGNWYFTKGDLIRPWDGREIYIQEIFD